MSRRVGIFGGAFNPPHLGHLRAALEVLETLNLEKVLLVPSGRHPFKGEDLLAPPHHRMAMTGLACTGVPGLEACDIEVTRSGVAYTIDTLSDLALRHPGVDPVFLMGSDLIDELHLWKSWQRLLDIAHVCLMTRPGGSGTHDDGPAMEWLQRHECRDLELFARDHPRRFGYVRVSIPPLAISSSEIRRRIRSGRSIRFLTTDQVVDYIDHHRLYRD
ncbi:MAG: nicotinate (nicotinamide) nucleotide adenylyltransferase [Magnetococcales bacterium]|nr:nicotinate (nicotinamide) nucleotide adenylyltransferase [Magnetococcales bacterium]